MFIPVFCFHLHLAKWPSGARFVQALREGFFFFLLFSRWQCVLYRTHCERERFVCENATAMRMVVCELPALRR